MSPLEKPCGTVSVAPASSELPLLDCDLRMLALYKPSGLLSVPGRGEELADSLARRVQARFPQARVVHRLDRDTSGVLIMALDLAAQQHLARQFEERRAQKVYRAVVAGVLAEEAGRIELPLAKDFAQRLPPRYRVDHEHGRPATTDFCVLRREADRTHVELRPQTGRSHQLRVHLAALGHAILGDPIYADESAPPASRLMLHAQQLTLEHPDGGERTWRAECPWDSPSRET